MPSDPHEIILLLVVLTFLVLSLCIHEAAHAYVAHLCGDDTAKQQGRLTLNPIDHIDPFMTILVPLMLFLGSNGSFVFGGARPVPVNAFNLRHPSRDMAWVALAGPVSNFILAIVFTVALKFLIGYYPVDSLMIRAIFSGISLNVFLALFNLIPIPPLDGSRIVMHFLPNSLKGGYGRLESAGILIVLGLFWLV
ncbi:MAG: site-2 protease family protein, partial [Planctomycetes bacterium]|nr:site-2 protease family protein [Planctomycetota bacterium]